MVVVLVEVINAQAPSAQAAWMVVVEVTETFMVSLYPRELADFLLKFIKIPLQHEGVARSDGVAAGG